MPWKQSYPIPQILHLSDTISGPTVPHSRPRRDKNENCLVYFIKRQQAEATCVPLYLCIYIHIHIRMAFKYATVCLCCSRQLEDDDNDD